MNIFITILNIFFVFLSACSIALFFKVIQPPAVMGDIKLVMVVLIALPVVTALSIYYSRFSGTQHPLLWALMPAIATIVCVVVLVVSVFSNSRLWASYKEPSVANMSGSQPLEKFDVAAFEAKQEKGEYYEKLDDGTTINQSYTENLNLYVETIVPATGWFNTYKEFYKNGNLKTKGLLFKKGSFESGVWIEADKKGNVIKTTDHDKPFKMNIDQIVAIALKEGVDFSKPEPDNGNQNSITRNIVDGKPTWFIQYNAGWVDNGPVGEAFDVGVIKIDDATGTVTKK